MQLRPHAVRLNTYRYIMMLTPMQSDCAQTECTRSASIDRYTLFVNMTNRGQNYFFTEENIVGENETNLLLYTVRCLSSIFVWQIIFFTKKYFVFVNETGTPTQILRTAYGEKPVCETWWTPFIHYLPYIVFFVFSPLFRCCSWIVYSGLMTHF